MPAPRFPLRAIPALLLIHAMLAPAGVTAADKTIIGAVEEVLLLPWGIHIPARIDTGAARTSLGAQELRIAGGVAHFKLRDSIGGRRMKLPILDWRVYRTSEGTDRRPIVEIQLCIGRKRVRTRVNLNKRRHLKYPLLIGRRVLAAGNFLVDVTASRTMQPNCDGARTRRKDSTPSATVPRKR